MIQLFVDRFMAAQSSIEADLRQAPPADYADLVGRTIDVVGTPNLPYGGVPDPERITVIDHGDYQGTQLFIIAAKGYQPSVFWSIFVPYGSCSGCDAMEGIREQRRGSASLSDEQVREYWTLMLHMVQSMRRLNEGDANGHD